MPYWYVSALYYTMAILLISRLLLGLATVGFGQTLVFGQTCGFTQCFVNGLIIHFNEPIISLNIPIVCENADTDNKAP